MVISNDLVMTMITSLIISIPVYDLSTRYISSNYSPTHNETKSVRWYPDVLPYQNLDSIEARQTEKD